MAYPQHMLKMLHLVFGSRKKLVQREIGINFRGVAVEAQRRRSRDDMERWIPSEPDVEPDGFEWR